MSNQYFLSKVAKVGVYTLVMLLPLAVYAQAPATFRDAAGLVVRMIQGIINILFALLAVGLLYGVVLYFVNSDNERKRTEIKGFLIWGIIGITVAFAIWGILAILLETFGWGAAGIPRISAPA